MVNKIIVDSLKAGKRIVIPQFGAFLHKDTDGGIVFVPFLKKDDGVLAGLLSSNYGLSSEEAYGVIAEYVAQVKKSVTERGCFVVEGIGQLKIDSNGVCYLETDLRDNKIPTTPGTSAARPVAPSQPASTAASSSMGGASRVGQSPISPSQPAYGQPGSNGASGYQAQSQSGSHVPNVGVGVNVPNQGSVASSRPQSVQANITGGTTQTNGTMSSRSATAQPSSQANQAASARSAMAGDVRPATQSGYQRPGQQGRPQQMQPQSSYASSQYTQQQQGRPAAQQPAQNQQTQARPNMPGQPSFYGGSPYGQPQGGASVPPYGGAGMPPRQPQPQQRQGTDKFLVVAIVAAIIALGAIIYGVIFASSSAPKIDPMELPVHQRPAVLDSIQKEDSIQAAEAAAKEAAKTKSKR